jgi:hypothetical protein
VKLGYDSGGDDHGQPAWVRDPAAVREDLAVVDREADEEERWGRYLREMEDAWGGGEDEGDDEVEVVGVKEGEKKKKRKRKRDKKKRHKKSKKGKRWGVEPLQEEEYTFSNN